MKEKPILSPRLLYAAELVRDGSFIADIGTDHAYLPIYLCLCGKVRGAVASDINRGPVTRAGENVNKYSLDGKISVMQADGLCGIEKFAPDDILILGMGGELIARIIEGAPWTRKRGIRLCLQPMTHAELLRAYLNENGFTVIREELAEEEKIYQLILAEYTGAEDTYTPAELLVGKLNAERGGELFDRLCDRQLEILQKRADGKRLGGDCAADEYAIMEELRRMKGNNVK